MYHASLPATASSSTHSLLLQPYDWTRELLSSFTFLMAGHGAPVCASMMLGDSEYAREQLRLACTFEDRGLQQIAVEMLAGCTPRNAALGDAARWSH